MTLNTITLSIMTVGIMPFGLMILSNTLPSIMAISKMKLKINNTEQNNIK